mgnify:CR=1 FL=1
MVCWGAGLGEGGLAEGQGSGCGGVCGQLVLALRVCVCGMKRCLWGVWDVGVRVREESNAC